ncbi:MAG: hypothetical protein H0W88_08610 [Parachlamydiaceae bacterium]|nr:hypothetical protein [Parachlamydiaceae bacterium]
MFSQIKHLENPDFHAIPIMERFEAELKKLKKSENRWKILTVAAIGIGIGGAGGVVVGAILKTRAVLILAASIALLATTSFLIVQSHLQEIRTALNEKIFTQVLCAAVGVNDYSINEDKVKVFAKYGNDCKGLEFPYGFEFEKKLPWVTVVPGLNFGEFVRWIKEQFKEKKLALNGNDTDSQKKLRSINNLETLCDELEIEHGNKVYFTLDYIELSSAIGKAHKKKELLLEKFEQAQNLEVKESIKKEIDNNRDKLTKELEERSAPPANKAVWNVNNLARIVKACPNLEIIKLVEVYGVKDVFGQCNATKEKGCEKHRSFNVKPASGVDRKIDLCQLKSSHDIWMRFSTHLFNKL